MQKALRWRTVSDYSSGAWTGRKSLKPPRLSSGALRIRNKIGPAPRGLNMPEQLQSLLRNPFFLIAVVALVLLVLALIIWLLMRRGKGKGDDDLRAELVEMEREHQFTAAADQLPFLRDAGAAAEEISQAFREYLGLPLVAAYAGREKDPHLKNVLHAEANDGQAPGLAASLPETLSASTLGNFWKPQQTKLGYFTGEMPASNFVTGSLVKPQDGDVALSEDEPAAAPPPQPAGQATLAAGMDIIVFPWRAAYDWTGVFLAQAAPLTPESLQRLREPVGRLADRLAVALEFERERQELFALDERASRSAAFARSVIACLDQPSPLACIAHEIANLMGAESAALWRIEPGGAMVRMVAAYGLKS